MNVADLQEYFHNLGLFVNKSGGAKLTADLDDLQRSLAPFAAMTVKEFADFLTGKQPPVKAAKPAKVKPNAEDLANHVRRLYDTINEPTVNNESVETVLGQLDKLTVADLKVVAGKIEYRVSKEKKPQIIEAIRNRILGRRGAHQRAGMAV
jgi:hypothetical protein